MRNPFITEDPFSTLIRRALEGKVGTVGLILILGFFSSLVLLYISLHVYFLDISEKIESERVKLLRLTNDNLYLKSRYHELISPKKIIPLARRLGMRPGSSEEIMNVAIKEKDVDRKKASGLYDLELKYVQAGLISGGNEK